MPIYEYECPHKHRFEKLVPVGTSQVTCSTCKDAKQEPSTAKKVPSIPAPAQGLPTPKFFPKY